VTTSLSSRSPIIDRDGFELPTARNDGRALRASTSANRAIFGTCCRAQNQRLPGKHFSLAHHAAVDAYVFRSELAVLLLKRSHAGFETSGLLRTSVLANRAACRNHGIGALDHRATAWRESCLTRPLPFAPLFKRRLQQHLTCWKFVSRNIA